MYEYPPVECGRVSSPKMTEIKKAINEEITHVLITNEANVTKENIQFYNTNGYTIYALYEGRRIASGILVAVKITLTSKLRVATEIKEGDTTETRIHVRCLGRALSFLQIHLFLVTNRNTIYLQVMPWDTHNSKHFWQ